MSGDIIGCHNWYACVGTIGIYWVKAKDDAKHPTIIEYSCIRRCYMAQISIVPILRKPDLAKYFSSNL